MFQADGDKVVEVIAFNHKEKKKIHYMSRTFWCLSFPFFPIEGK